MEWRRGDKSRGKFNGKRRVHDPGGGGEGRGREKPVRKEGDCSSNVETVPARSSFSGHVNGHYLFQFRGMVKSSMRLEDLTIVPTQWPTFTPERYSKSGSPSMVLNEEGFYGFI